MIITTDWDSVKANFNNLNRNLSKNIIIRNEGMANNIANKAKAFSRQPKGGKSGKLANAILALRIGDGKGYRIISKTPSGARGSYNVFQEYGVSPNPAYVYVPWLGVDGKMLPVEHPYVQHFFAMGKLKGTHPGFVGKQFMFKAFKWAEKEYPKSIRNEVTKTIRETLK